MLSICSKGTGKKQRILNLNAPQEDIKHKGASCSSGLHPRLVSRRTAFQISARAQNVFIYLFISIGLTNVLIYSDSLYSEDLYDNGTRTVYIYQK